MRSPASVCLSRLLKNACMDLDKMLHVVGLSVGATWIAGQDRSMVRCGGRYDPQLVKRSSE